MTKHIQIHPEANAEAVRRLLAQARDERVVLELPEGWTELDNMARMRLLQRQAQLLNMDVALVTRHDATRKAAKQVGVPVFYRAEDAAGGGWGMKPLAAVLNPKQPDAGLPDAPHWRRGDVMQRVRGANVRRTRQQRIQAEERYRQPTPLWVRWLWNAFAGLLMVIFLAGFTLYVLPAATVTVTPGREPISVSVRLIADPALDAPDFNRNRLPARLLETNIVEQGTQATTGTRQKASGNAGGRVTFTNQGPDPVTVPDGTVVSTVTGTLVRFRTRGDVTVPGGLGQRVDAVIEALEPGIDGNVLPNTIGNISGALRFRLNVTNPQGTGGGGAALVNVVTQEDRDQLLAETTARAEGDAYQALQESAEPGEWLPEESVLTYVIAQAFGQFNDEESDELTLDLRLLAQGTAVEDALSTQAALTELRRAIPDMGRLVTDSITYRREPGVVTVGRSVEYTVTASAEYVIPIDAAEVRDLIAGTRPADAIAALQQRWQLERPPEIYRDPELLPTLPTLPNRIQVRVEYEGALEEDTAP
ncbi:MAG: hypothetical protein H6641_18495 [Caldilineaceae bacterium]|nr:hypothetical protein [Caldilineaceae bacterium]